MPSSFNDPEIKAAMAAASVVHQPGTAQDVLHDLAPFLAEEGIDLNDPGEAGLDDINAALAQATARYNASLASARPSLRKSERKRPTRRPGEPKLSQSDRSLARDFERWLHQQDEIAAPGSDILDAAIRDTERGVLARLSETPRAGAESRVRRSRSRRQW